MKTRHFFLLVLLQAMALAGFAYDFEVDGVYYVKTGDGTVAVTSERDGTGHGSPETPSGYTGDVVIPGTIVADGATYRVTAVGEGAFMGAQVASVVLPEGVETIEPYAFSYSPIGQITLPSTLHVVGEYAFAGAQLTHIDLPEGLQEIGQCAFYGSGIREVTIPSTVSSIGVRAFTLCGYDFQKWASAGLQRISVADGNEQYDSRNDCNAVVETATHRLVVGSMSTVIGSDIRVIGTAAFEYLPIKVLVLPASIDSYESYCFVNCTQLDTIYSYRPDPVETTMGVFMFMSPEPHALLYVPEGSKEKYAATAQWNIFSGEDQIREFSTLGIHGATTGLTAPTATYDLQGRRLQPADTTLPSLPQGVYIRNGRKIAVR